MKHLVLWVATLLKRPACFCSLQIVAGIVSAKVAGSLNSFFQALDHVAVDSINDHVGAQILHSIPVLARLSGDLHANALTAPLAGALVGALLAILGSGLKNHLLGGRSVRVLGERSALDIDHVSEKA